MRRAFLVIAIALALACACATKVAESGSASFTSVSSNLVVRELDDDQRKRVCVDAAIFLSTALTDDEQKALRCQLEVLAFTLGGASIGCEDTFRSCMAGEPGYIVDRQLPDFTLCGRPSDGTIHCTATVGELDECLRAHARAGKSWADLGTAVCSGSPIPGASCLHSSGCGPLVQNAMPELAQARMSLSP